MAEEEKKEEKKEEPKKEEPKKDETDGLELLEKEDLMELVRTLKANEKKEEPKKTDEQKRREIMEKFLNGDASIKQNGGNENGTEKNNTDEDDDEVLERLRKKLKGR